MKKEDTFIALRPYSTHVARYRYEPTDFYCMNCGKKSVWEDDQDDYYQGNAFVCFSCGAYWQNPSGVRMLEWYEQLKQQWIKWNEEL